ncbi:V-type ATPase subunit family protein [Porphyromonas circumdentaria]|uniref:V-type ATPase subunit family protein n=1 Tax=Porphyromonas circumdentaria TaxID=29524 RepID=A0A1T4NA21_9PORP|nr:V/A-type H+-transporting ATPase subunit I [Porphyromonas circumdentaria]SJZ76089.1 V-type ATPase subunit family protein [Porphyromonas circumdentaria]
MSYIRLFAIGLTGGILGGVFNNLAVQIGGDLPAGLNFIVMGIILLFGHGLNFGLCMISSLVHPLRLTFVEFYKNSEFEGGGREYRPFKL